MKPVHRKKPKFFVVNPSSDRRSEDRFISMAQVVIKVGHARQGQPGTAYDIGRKGMMIRTIQPVEVGESVQVLFPDNLESIRCLGKVAWSRIIEPIRGYESGIKIREWLGIVKAQQSWRRYKGFKLKRDRRNQPR